EAEMINNPFPITKEGLDRAKGLYNIYCGICHGEKGDGQGWLVSMPDTKYPAQPKNLIGDDMIAAGNGRLYFAIMYGKNVMGAYTDKLSFEERWQVIHYIRSLQAKSKSLEYSETANTLSNVEKPAKGAASGPARVVAAPAQ
ncbi:MAG: cytochrome c, partial [Saprospiraceae bacterium]|nr:cytochrome c [Saprospiraceae bacterium]